ncbi:hypothetical protein H9X57_14400 [Flavobacterium piscinae]|uniref:Beta-lactamase-related domain-containing protein n=1 Tax=Flavobacterium piscinae TaxID=2506424 RepID=A0A4V1N586_9FLAO|nr:hypothetical protein [Flavobacterium piscinae]MBC8884107.1 hypothetical protein [Flavobacterium piscinae]RXR34796.1 hypothetical protein EQG68_02485 [Flavobacterium piscinae]
MKISLGWHIPKSEKDFNPIWDNGGIRRYSSTVVLNFGNKYGIIILSNASAFNLKIENIDKLCFELMNQVENYK